ncbi:polysaccharide deacetylase family protein [Flavihumibacter rivuli]|uniref:polysaccharide deacetylase family protein n=1 Tax=Flavihumibacter rivuli TaxID=2838156 RepID=UPI001BDF6136|nr:polysaccharide deacetylase family protein [Flavihumibacter rivuli]ULQ55140.1 polysaccharide deacetylase family protein [Flavihumibacter rivuli]
MDLISNEILVEPCAITTEKDVFLHYDGARINYSKQQFDCPSLQIVPSSLLFEQDIQPASPEVKFLDGQKVMFVTEGGDLGFDLLAASFYLVSRYEEYTSLSRDSYGRYSHTDSLAWKENFLHEPLVNTWILYLQEKLLEIFPGQLFRRKSFRFIPTYDIDMMFSFLHKGLIRNIGGTIRSVMKGNYRQAKQRVRVLRGKEKDPYDAYEWLDALHLYCRVRPVYFFLVAQKQLGYDKNIPTEVKSFQELINYYASVFEVGIHPSWQSSTSPDDRILREEKEWMEVIADKEITKSRQHYIKFTLPEGYRRLLAAGIKEDFSMGYGTINGFRASYSSPFRWFDLERNEATDLMVYPFCFMDANSFYEQKQTPQQAYNELMRLYAAVKKVRGTFITVWHNSFLGTDLEFKGWREVYEVFMKEDAYWDAG